VNRLASARQVTPPRVYCMIPPRRDPASACQCRAAAAAVTASDES